MYRLGPSTASSILGVYPDIAVYGKMLSGGYMALAATLATSETFEAFLGKKKWHALLHGHSFTVSHLLLNLNLFGFSVFVPSVILCFYSYFISYLISSVIISTNFSF